MKFILLVYLLTLSSIVLADKWHLESNKITKLIFGKLYCEAHSNPTNAVRFPKKKLECFQNEKVEFEKNLGAERFYVSKDGEYLLGVSNSGLDDNAFWIIDSKGNDIIKRTHRQEKYDGRTGIYCGLSITLDRTWVSKDPRPEFTFNNDKLIDVKVISCRRKSISLFDIKNSY